MNKLYTEEEVRLIIEGAIAEEREACAMVCDQGSEQMLHKYQREGASRCAEAIRSRG